jgi:glycosyltransferase involved in cell wall biosynthesis
MDQVVALTRQEAEQVRRDYWAARAKQTVIGWGASPLEGPRIPKPSAARQALEAEGCPLNILCVGRLGRHKAQEWLLDVYGAAQTQFHRPTRLVLVGRDEGGEASLRESVQLAGLEEAVMFTGELDDAGLVDWYRRADLFSLFSHYEAFGLVFFEAMIAGVPVLTHAVGANQELLTRGAVVVPRFDREAAITGLVRLVNDAEYRHRLGQEAREYALAEFTWSAVAQKYLDVYRTKAPGVSLGIARS